MVISKALVWFRNNLRLHDNRTIAEATARHKEIVFVYVFDERHWKLSPIGQNMSSPRKLSFLWCSVIKLQQEIEKLGGSLLVVKGEQQEEVVKTMQKYQCEALYTTEEPGVYEALSLANVEKALMQKGMSVNIFNESTLYHPDDIPWPINKLPSVFTKFRKENEKQTSIREIVVSPTNLAMSKLQNLQKIAAEDFSIQEMNKPEKGTHFEAGEQAAFKRLSYYFDETDLIKTYKETRNGMIGIDFSSKLSAWLANGSISPRSVYQQLKNYEQKMGANQSTYWLFFELLWRDYFHFIMKKHGAHLFSKKGIQEEEYQWKREKDIFDLWCKGETGIPMIDANMRELNETGYMSNRGRQLVASFLTHDLEIDWRWGAYYFERQLVDYDVASNWGNWAYVAGVGNDPRNNRYFNILSQAKRYDNSGEYVRLWLPELKEIEGFNAHIIALLDHDIVINKVVVNRERYVYPIVDMQKWDY
jgi:deoxyribodipyrimidine photo-lyase